MTIPVVTAVSDPAAEAAIMVALSAPASGVTVVRRCVDIADLLAAATAGLARGALVAADLRRLDGDALTRLAVAGVAVVGVMTADDESVERRLRQLGVTVVVAADATAEQLGAALRAAIDSRAGRPQPTHDLADPVAPLRHDEPSEPAAPVSGMSGAGRVVAVWGPAGSPGRSTVATSLAAAAARHAPVLLIDADVYGGSVAQLLGILDEAPGLAAACRLANQGSLDVPTLAGLAVALPKGPRVLTGIVRADRWPELRPTAVEAVLELSRSLAALVVVDCGFCLEQDEELSYDTIAPRRNGATLAALGAADLVLGVARADPVGLARYVRGLAQLRDSVPGVAVQTVVNRVRRGATGPGDPRREIVAALERYASLTDVCFVPDDAAVDGAMAAGRALPDAAPQSPAAVALRALATEVLGVPASTDRGRARRARRRS